MDSDLGMTDTRYEVVVNDEGQYSIWDAERRLPVGWRMTGKRGTKEECLAHIREVWTDVTPLSVRQRAEVGRDV